MSINFTNVPTGHYLELTRLSRSSARKARNRLQNTLPSIHIPDSGCPPPGSGSARLMSMKISRSGHCAIYNTKLLCCTQTMGSVDSVYLVPWSSSGRSYVNWLIHPVCPKKNIYIYGTHSISGIPRRAPCYFNSARKAR